jgi:hypothetical protein
MHMHLMSAKHLATSQLDMLAMPQLCLSARALIIGVTAGAIVVVTH